MPFCTETVNPHGQNVPPAGSTTLPGPRGGINDDGFYEVGADVGTDVILRDTDGNVFGVFDSGTKVKYTEANGAEPSVKKIGSANGQAGAIDFHITGTGDLVVVSRSKGSADLPGSAATEVEVRPSGGCGQRPSPLPGPRATGRRFPRARPG